MTINSTATRERILAAAKNLWQTDADVKAFALQYHDSALDESSGGWEFPVISGAEDVDAYELTRAIERIQEKLEKETGEFISVYLDLGV